MGLFFQLCQAACVECLAPRVAPAAPGMAPSLLRCAALAAPAQPLACLGRACTAGHGTPNPQVCLNTPRTPASLLPCSNGACPLGTASAGAAHGHAGSGAGAAAELPDASFKTPSPARQRVTPPRHLPAVLVTPITAGAPPPAAGRPALLQLPVLLPKAAEVTWLPLLIASMRAAAPFLSSACLILPGLLIPPAILAWHTCHPAAQLPG